MIKKKIPWQNLLAGFGLYLVIVTIGLLFYTRFMTPTEETQEIDLSRAIQLIGEDKIKKVVVEDGHLTLTAHDGTVYRSYKEKSESLITLLAESGVSSPAQKTSIEIKNVETQGFWLGLLSNFLPILFMILLFVFIFRQARQASGSIFNFGRSTARLFDRRQQKVTFADVAGVDEAKQELTEVVDFLKHPEKYRRLGARIPKGVLLVGPAGVGKTLMARAVAGEAEVPFYSMAGSEFMEMLVGVGSARVRDLFNQAKQTAPSIIFIDEIESIGRHRGMITASHGEQEQTLNQILVEMDGFEPKTNVIVLAASNRPDLLDPALTRPGRFDRRVVLEMPDISGREAIIEVHRRGKPLAKSVDVSNLAKRTVGFSGADLENMLNEAAILAAREGSKEITNHHLEEAATRVKLGPERKRLQSEEDKKLTAYHEAGHAIVAYWLPHVDPVHRVSIVARGLALGYTQIAPQIDRYNQTRTRLLELITMMLGGRAAEEMVFDEMTVGAGTDLEHANLVARKMVMEFGMSGLGPVTFKQHGTDDALSMRYLIDREEVSQKLLAQADDEVKKIINECLKRAEKILRERRKKLDLVSQRLFEQETLEAQEFEKLMKG